MTIMRWQTKAQSHDRYHWFVVGAVCVGAFMAALDASIINIALPALKHDFHTHMSTIEWVSLTYMLTLAALIVPFSRLSDIVGRRKMYTLGFVVFLVGSLWCGLSSSLGVLLCARVVQAAGAAMLQANSVAIITQVTPACDRGKAIGVQASAQGIGLSLGPFIGGALVSTLGWRWIFYVNVPVGILGTLVGMAVLPTHPPRPVRERFDAIGTLCFLPTLAAFMYVLNEGIHAGLASRWMVISDCVTALGFVGFVFAESRARFPLIDLTLFKRRTFLYGNLSVLLSFAVMYGVMFLTPFYLDNVRHLNSFTAGLYLTIIPIGMTVMTPVAGVITDTVSVRLPVLVGMALTTMGCALLALSIQQGNTTELVLGLLLVGSGMGLFTPSNNSQVMGSAPSEKLGIAGGVLNTARTIGMGIGVSMGGLSYQLFLRQRGVSVENLATPSQMMQSFRDACLFIAAVAAVITLFSVYFTRPRHATPKGIT